MVGNWFPAAKGWVSVTVELLWGTFVTGCVMTFPWKNELLSEVKGLTEDWDCMGCELNEEGAVVFVSSLTGDDHRVKSGKVDGGWTFDNKFPGGGFMIFGDCLENVEAKLPLTDSKRKRI